MMPFGPSRRPVCAGAATPCPYSKFNVAPGMAVLLFEGVACHWNVWFTGVLVALLNEDATKSSGCDTFPADAVAAPVAGNTSVPRIALPPWTSNAVVGAVVLMPIFAVAPLPVCVMAELWTLVAVVQSGRAFTVPPLVVTVDAGGGALVTSFEVAAPPTLPAAPPLGNAANTNALGGSPPIVAASPAFNAYGTLSNITRACSSPPFTRTPSQRASPDAKSSTGRPSDLVAPSWIL